MYIYFVLIGIYIGPFLFFDWHARFVFVLTGYPRRYGHGKSGARAEKHYKANWSLIQRLLWIPMFKEWYETKYRIMAYLSYIHFALTIVCSALFLISDSYFPDSKIWIYCGIVYHIFYVLRFIYDNAIGRKDI